MNFGAAAQVLIAAPTPYFHVAPRAIGTAMSTTTPNNLEERVASIEVELAFLKRQLQGRNGSSTQRGNEAATWVDQISGSFEGDESFREILRLGRESRKASPEVRSTDDA
jgi:hypothetical protein